MGQFREILHSGLPNLRRTMTEPLNVESVDSQPIQKRVDTITALLIIVMIGLIFIAMMLAVSHSGFDKRLDTLEEAMRNEMRLAPDS